MSTTDINVDRFLKIGQTVTLMASTRDQAAEESGVHGYTTRVEDLTPTDLIVGWPTDQAVHVAASVGQPVSLEIKCHLGVLLLDSKISAIRRSPLPFLHVSRDGDWSRSQLRTSVRLDVAIIPQETRLFSSNGHTPNGNGSPAGHVDLEKLKKGQVESQPIRVAIRNLSAAGLLLVSETGLEPGSVLRICFALGTNEVEIEALAVVVRAVGDSGTKAYPFTAGCKFINLPMRDQDKISRFILTRQAQLRRSGLL